MKEILAYKCDYCKKYYLSKASAKRHENKCFYNPNSRACLTCGNFLHYSNTIYVPPQLGDWGYGEHDYDVNVNYCQSSKKSFDIEHISERQEFQHNCKNWIQIKCGRDCDHCNIECVFEGEN